MVHPRMRGEHDSLEYSSRVEMRFIPACAGNTAHAAGRVSRASGSSPHARGTPFWAPGPHRQVWFIPACAGNTCRGLVAGMVSSVHPRMRGEHASVANLWTCPAGSSPHARGTRRPQSCLLRGGRFIPACAGNTLHPVLLLLILSVHPRMRGEHYTTTTARPSLNGSSPHARGTPVSPRPAWPFPWFIPACAGNTRDGRGRMCARSVHPRMRGEHQAAIGIFGALTGSSPHARGTHRPLWAVDLIGRFIPACAGNTDAHLHCLCHVMVHPRMRGEHFPEQAAEVLYGGSSPHARGTPQIDVPHAGVSWFIPACAGNTHFGPCFSGGFRVHPRMRGEHSMPGPCSMACTGSSPHARGTRAPIRGFLGSCRFIPACAGNTAGPCCRWV